MSGGTPDGEGKKEREGATQGLRAKNGNIRFSLGVCSGMKWVDE